MHVSPWRFVTFADAQTKNVTNPDIPELTKRRSARNAEEEGLSLYKPVVSLTERQKRFVRFMPVMKPEWSARFYHSQKLALR
jgi:hypothetical protein